MYSRYPGRSDRPIRLPEHYSGCAFPSPSARPARPSEYPPISVPFAPVSDLPQEAREEKKAEQEAPLHREEPERPVFTPPLPPPSEAKEEPPAPQPPQSKDLPVSGMAEGFRSLFGGKFPAFPGGMSFDELLIIGLILLLSHSEQDSDVILWLALLLFCK